MCSPVALDTALVLWIDLDASEAQMEERQVLQARHRATRSVMVAYATTEVCALQQIFDDEVTWCLGSQAVCDGSCRCLVQVYLEMSSAVEALQLAAFTTGVSRS